MTTAIFEVHLFDTQQQAEAYLNLRCGKETLYHEVSWNKDAVIVHKRSNGGYLCCASDIDNSRNDAEVHDHREETDKHGTT